MTEEYLPDYITIPYPIYRDDALEGVDRVIYGIVYFYVHMKNRKCFASNANLAELAGVQERTVRSALTRLEDRGYIKRTYKDEGRRHRVEIEALISFKGKLDGSLEPTRRTQNVPLDGSLEPHKKNTKKKIKKLPTRSAEEEKDIADIIYEFRVVNPSYKLLYERSPQRESVARLLTEHGKDKLEKVVKYLRTTNANAFAPTITTPQQLERDLGRLIAWGAKQKSKAASKGRGLEE